MNWGPRTVYHLTLRSLTDRRPEQWAAWLLGRPPDACRLLETHLPRLEREGDLLLQITLAGKTFLQHTEFQTEYDPDMPRRMLFYHVGFLLQYDLPVRSTVVWLTPAGDRAARSQPEMVEEAVRWATRIPDKEGGNDVSLRLAVLAGRIAV